MAFQLRVVVIHSTVLRKFLLQLSNFFLQNMLFSVVIIADGTALIQRTHYCKICLLLVAFNSARWYLYFFCTLFGCMFVLQS